jgi:hypothetical protein
METRQPALSAKNDRATTGYLICVNRRPHGAPFGLLYTLRRRHATRRHGKRVPEPIGERQPVGRLPPRRQPTTTRPPVGGALEPGYRRYSAAARAVDLSRIRYREPAFPNVLARRPRPAGLSDSRPECLSRVPQEYFAGFSGPSDGPDVARSSEGPRCACELGVIFSACAATVQQPE